MKVSLYHKQTRKEITQFPSIPLGRKYCAQKGYTDMDYTLVFQPRHGVWDWWYSVEKPGEPMLKTKKRLFSWEKGDDTMKKLKPETLCFQCKYLTHKYYNDTFSMKKYCPERGCYIDAGFWRCKYFAHIRGERR